jgi:exodeoxyribonuclease V gamma subunit
MRAIPFRYVALLGMNDGDYPRSRPPADFDLMAKDWRPGDRSRREDDRYMFLEALLSARERLHISWVGRSIHDNQEQPPSVLVSQLRDHLAAGWRLSGDAGSQSQAGEALLDHLTLAHRLQPFNPAYFTTGDDERLFSFAREWRAVESGRAAAGADGPPPATTPLPVGDWQGPLTLKLLSDFVKNPARSFFQQRLGIRFENGDTVGSDQEPFAIDALENWQLQDELIQVQKAALETGGSPQAELVAQLNRMAMRGELPVGSFGALVQDELSEPMPAMFDAYAKTLAAWPQSCADELLDHLPTGAEQPLRLVDWLAGMRRNEAGQRGRVLLDSGSLIRRNMYRYDKLLPFWVAHLAGHLAGEPMTTVVISKAGQVCFGPLAPQQAQQQWVALLEAWRVGHRLPLPLALACGFSWLAKGGKASMLPDAALASGAYAAARAKYEVHEPDFKTFGERDSDAYLARAFHDFNALWADGAFAVWADALLRPLMDAPKTMSNGQAA